MRNSSSLTFHDYKSILEHYKKPIPKNKQHLKQEAENILGSKLCKCIKQINVPTENEAIAYCTQSIYKNRGLDRKNFTCKKKIQAKFTFHNNKKKLKKNKPIKSKTVKNKTVKK